SCARRSPRAGDRRRDALGIRGPATPPPRHPRPRSTAAQPPLRRLVRAIGGSILAHARGTIRRGADRARSLPERDSGSAVGKPETPRARGGRTNLSRRGAALAVEVPL